MLINYLDCIRGTFIFLDSLIRISIYKEKNIRIGFNNP